jgi:hypothetical protein
MNEIQGATHTNTGHFDPAAGATEPGIGHTIRNTELTVAERAHTALADVKEKAIELPSMLADKLEDGADAIRPDRVATMLTPGDTSTPTRATKSTIAQATEKLADGMQASAEWLRNADGTKMLTAIEQQVKERPGRTLLVALGAGYVLGKTIRR